MSAGVCVLMYFLCSAARSPVFSHLSSSLQGLWTIRAFRAEERFQNTFDAHQDLHTESWFLFLVTSRWFALRLDGICAAFVTVTAFGCLFLRDGKRLNYYCLNVTPYSVCSALLTSALRGPLLHYISCYTMVEINVGYI